MWFPPSKANLYETCGGDCAKSLRDAIKASRARPCQTCGEVFVPRTTQLAAGHGMFCSQKCNTKSHAAMNSQDAQARARAAFKSAISQGRYVPATGDAAPRWKGGPEVCWRRRVASGRCAELVREYRKRNPHKVKEFSRRRKDRKLGSLPRGTVKRIGNAQRWKCAACSVKLDAGYHVDHITPLARGGEHSPANLQLLCPTCNVRKSAKDPIAFMQERGFLL